MDCKNVYNILRIIVFNIISIHNKKYIHIIILKTYQVIIEANKTNYKLENYKGFKCMIENILV